MTFIRGEGMKIGKKQHEDKKTRVSPYLDPQTFENVRKLAFACRTTEAKIILEMIDSCLLSENWVAYIQSKFRVQQDSPDRVVPTKIDGRVVLTRI
jgi:hypothetical protein